MITLVYETRFGLARGTVCVNGCPHFYREGLEFDPALARWGVRSVARLTSKSAGMAFVQLADGSEAVLDAPVDVMSRLNEGAALRVEIIAEARDHKRARAKFLDSADGEPRRLGPPPSIADTLRALSRQYLGAETLLQSESEGLLDQAEADALNPSYPLSGGGFLSIERTRGLIACDVDSAGGEGVLTPKAFAKACNDRAVDELVRRLRLSGLAGLVVVDLIGRKHDSDRLRARLLDAFGAEKEGVIVGPIGKFGTLEFVRPWSTKPLMDEVGSPLRQAHLLLREAVRRADGEPGRLLTLKAPPTTLECLRPLLKNSYDPLAAIIRLEKAARPEVISL